MALNKCDLNRKNGTEIDTAELEKRLLCPVVETVSTSGEGLAEIIGTASGLLGMGQRAAYSEEGLKSSGSSQEELDRRRFEFVNGIVSAVEKRTVLTREKNLGDKIDAVLTNKWLGIPIFAVVMFFVFHISQAEGPLGLGKWLEGLLAGGIDAFQGYIAGLMESSSPLLQAIVVDGIIGGVSAVMGFLPLVMVMYFLISLLEDCGYMSRAAVVLDPIFKKVGLSGRSVIPFVITVGCAVPGIMASRTIRSERERRATAMLAPFMPCGAKIPVIALFAGAFFDNAGWVSALMYFAGIALIFVGALLINLITGYRARKSYFIIELPQYKLPSLIGAFKSMCQRGWSYIAKAATIILLCNMAVQLMQSFTWSFSIAESADSSILASIATPFAYILAPVVGVVSWQLAAAAVTGFIAKENVVGTLAVCFAGLESLIDADELVLMEGAGAEVAVVMGLTKAAALAYLMFNLYTPPCFAAIGAMNSEMKSAKWLWGGIGLQLGVGYTVAYFVYTIGTLLSGGGLNPAMAAGGLFVVILFIAVTAGIAIRSRRAGAEERAAA